ncbi:MAG: BLUF domain-containing protein [Proteobacteria bacterium]|nr:BLUF domain-containing protein [Pseudomonadota bacterium]
MLSLYRTLYISRAAPGVLDRLLESASQIVATSDRNNSRLGVTGALLAHDGWFVQAIEGERARLSSLLLKIARDPRHGALEILTFAPAESRLFEGWAMAHATVTPEVAPLLGRVEALGGGFDPDRMDADVLVTVLGAAMQARSSAA